MNNRRKMEVALASTAILIGVAIAMAGEDTDWSVPDLIDRYGISLAGLIAFLWATVYWFAPWISKQFEEGKQYLLRQIEDARTERTIMQDTFLKALKERDQNRKVEIEEILSHITKEITKMGAIIVDRLDSKRLAKPRKR